MLDILEYYQMLKGKNINIIYSGPAWSEGVEGVGSTLRKRLEFDEMSLSSSQSVFSVFVEQMNNTLMYSADRAASGSSDENNPEASSDVFILGACGKSYFVQSGNVLKKEVAEFVKENIDYLNTLSKTELRKHYKEQMKIEKANPDVKGSGLELIEIARRATSRIEYQLHQIDEDTTFFSMYVTIEHEEEDT